MIGLARRSLHPSTLALTTAAFLLTACASAPSNPVTQTILPARAGISGVMHGGQQAVSGATIQLWAVGTAGDGSASTPLLNPAVTTDAYGNFNITGLYTCPSASSLVYLTGTGGNPGLTIGTNNTALAMMAALGTCGNLSASTYIVMNEVTTIGSVFALAPYMNSYSAIGYGSDLPAITAAFNEVNEFVNIATGTAGGPALPPGYGVNIPLINTLADFLAICINSDGTGSGCSTVFGITDGAVAVGFANDTILAANEIAHNPTRNITPIFNSTPPASPFQPQLKAAPSAWAISGQPMVFTPTIYPSGGTYTSPQIVIITDSTLNAVIHYTLDGTTPTEFSPILTNGITVSANETINAIASLSGYLDSSVASASYIISGSGYPSGTILPFAGNGTTTGSSGDGGQATQAGFISPYFIAFDPSGNAYITDFSANRVRKVTPGGIISTFAGNGTGSDTGDGGQASAATVYGPNGVTTDASGNVYISEERGRRIRKVTPAGIITTIAGNGSSIYGGDGVLAINSGLGGPEGIALDSTGNLYVADAYGYRILKINTSGIISTVAGTGSYGYNGDNIQASTAQLAVPYGVAVDTFGNVYISDTYSQRIRKVNTAGIITTVAGNGVGGFADSSVATNGELNTSLGINFDSHGSLYIADQYNCRIRKLSSGALSTVVGTGTCSYSGDYGPATSATMRNSEGVAFDPAGNLYLSDGQNGRIRKVVP
jgi:sugar lactone lactonase YvrE